VLSDSFIPSLADEKNEKKKETIRKRADEYLKRAEQIKDAGKGPGNGPKQNAGGTASKKKDEGGDSGEKKDDENERFRGALEGATGRYYRTKSKRPKV